MRRPEKVEIVAEIKDSIQNSKITVLAHYIGINVAQVTELRSKFRKQGVRFKVYKNTLARVALGELGLAEAGQFVEGPTAWAFSDDPVAPTKILKEFAKGVKVVGMNGGIFNGEVVSKEQLEALAELPSRDELLARVAGTLAAPLRNLVTTLNAVPRNLVCVLDQVRKQREEQQAA